MNVRRLLITAVLLPLILVTSALFSEPAEDHWTADADTEIWLLLKDALNLIRSQQFDEAITLLSDLAQQAPENAEVYNLLGYAYRKSGDFENSLPAYEHALVLMPNHKGALEYQGELFLALDQPDKAIVNLQKLQRLCPTGCEELAELKDEILRFQRSIESDN